MEINKYKHTNVSPDGIVKDGGAVGTTGGLRMSNGEGCGAKGCKCSEGYWISITLPRTEDGVVEGIKAQLSESEIKSFLEKHDI